LKNLAEFDDFKLTVAARLALESAPVMIRLVGLDAGEPHRRAAFGTVRMSDFLRRPLDPRVLHDRIPALDVCWDRQHRELLAAQAAVREKVDVVLNGMSLATD